MTKNRTSAFQELIGVGLTALVERAECQAHRAFTTVFPEPADERPSIAEYRKQLAAMVDSGKLPAAHAQARLRQALDLQAAEFSARHA